MFHGYQKKKKKKKKKEEENSKQPKWIKSLVGSLYELWKKKSGFFRYSYSKLTSFENSSKLYGKKLLKKIEITSVTFHVPILWVQRASVVWSPHRKLESPTCYNLCTKYDMWTNMQTNFTHKMEECWWPPLSWHLILSSSCAISVKKLWIGFQNSFQNGW